MRTKKKVFFILILFFFGFCIFNSFGYQFIKSHAIEDSEIKFKQQQSETERIASKLKSELEFALSERLFSAIALEAFVVARDFDLSQEDTLLEFNAMAEVLYTSSKDVRSLQLAPKAVVTYVYPLAGNEKAVGHDLLADDKRRTEVLLAIENEDYIVTGPVDLIQGGNALIARLPIYVQPTSTDVATELSAMDSFWGFATVLIDTDTLYKIVDEISESENVAVSLRGRHGAGADGEVFYGDAELFNDFHINESIRLPVGSWQLGIRPNSGWYNVNPLHERTALLSFGILALLNIILIFLLYEPYVLRRKIAENTLEISSLAKFPSENPEPVLRVTDTNQIVFANNASNELLKDIFKDEKKKLNEGFFLNLSKKLKTAKNGKMDWQEGNRYYLIAYAKPKDESYTNLYFRDITVEKQVDKVKTEFVSLASHQLRTPLSIINWYTEALLKRVGKENLSKKVIEYITEIQIGNKRMNELVNTLLNVTRYELGEFRVEPQSLNTRDFLAEMTSQFSKEAKQKRLTVKTSTKKLPSIMADINIMTLILDNLLSNAIKYSKSGSVIKVRVEPVNKTNFTIEVTNTGYGIPEDQKDKIFSKMFRADNVVSTDTTGSGLGLYIVKSLVEAVKGKISFDSVENKTTTFRVELPIKMRHKKGTSKFTT